MAIEQIERLPDVSFIDDDINLDGIQKQMLKDFAEQFANMTFEIVDETFGYNTTKFEGYLYLEEGTVECNISIYHMGDMSYLTDK